jgi:pimeloyl-ACP methyl ester carboxylesterase
MSRYASLPGGATLFYTDEGAGEPLLLVHGWTCDSNDYLWQVAHFRATRRVIAPDLRGHGRSAVLPDGYDARTFARDLVELLDLLGVATCVAVGHSLAG